MALTIYIKNTLTGFEVEHSEDQELKKQLKLGHTYKAVITNPRNVRFHRKFFVLLNIVFTNLPHDFALNTATGQELPIRTTKDILWHIKMQNGHYTTKITLGGKVTYEADSISFAKMDEVEFNEFYSAAIDVILKHFLVGTNREELENIVIHQFT